MKLAALVELWRATLAPEVALAAHHAAAQLPHDDWPDNPKELQEEWLRRARGKLAPDDVAELMRVSDFGRATAKQLIARLDLMVAWKPDPNVTRWLVDVFARPTRQPTLEGGKCFRRVLNLLCDHVDLGGAAQLRAWTGTSAERLGASEWAASFYDEGFARVLKKSTARLAKARPLTAKELGELAASGLMVAAPKPATTQTLESLLADVYATPWDDGPRAVLADFLQERGDLRGELIALDLLPSPTPEHRKRRKELLAKHGKAWFPAALDRLIKRDAEYQRGFLARGTLLNGNRTPIELATFRELQIRAYQNPDIDHDAFRGIESWRGLRVRGDDDRARLCKRAHPRVRRIGWGSALGLAFEATLEVLRPELWPAVTEVVVEVATDRMRGWSEPGVPRWIDELVAAIASRLPGASRITIAPLATFNRDGVTSELFLPPYLCSCLTNPLGYTMEARDRWLAWLRERAVPIAVETEQLAASLSTALAGLEIRVAPAPEWTPLT